MNAALPKLEINPSAQADACVIWLHGLGADGYDFEPIVPELGLGPELAVRFVFPHAPERPITINGGMTMRAWYDIVELSLEKGVDADDIEASAALVRALIAAEIEAGIAPERIILAGFSQGGTVALHTALSLDQPIGGIMALSTWLPASDSLRSRYREHNLKTPILMAHGHVDPVLPMQLGIMAREYLRELGCEVNWNEYMMEHGVCADQIRDIGRWLTSLLSDRGK